MSLELHPDLKAPWVPDIGVRLVPEEQRQDANAFYNNLYDLQKWANDFASSLALYNFAQSQPNGDFGPTFLMRRWQMLAARNGALALRNFCQNLAAARGIVGKVSFWKGRIDLKALKGIERDFRSQFPDIDKLRHAVAHPEFYADPSINMKGKPAEIPGFSFMGYMKVRDALGFGGTYATTINGMTVHYQLSRENALFVRNLTLRSYAAVSQLVADASSDAEKVEHSVEGNNGEVTSKD